ncbi:hypothetical protein LCGC14_2775720, partial [marine sediment metagenome]
RQRIDELGTERIGAERVEARRAAAEGREVTPTTAAETTVLGQTRKELEALKKDLFDTTTITTETGERVTRQAAASMKLVGLIGEGAFRNWNQAAAQVDKLLGQIRDIPQATQEAEGPTRSLEAIEQERVKIQRAIDEAVVRQTGSLQDQKRLDEDIQTLKDRELLLTSDIAAAEKALADVTDNKDAILARNIIKLRQILDQQRAIEGIERERSQATDPERIAALDRQLSFERDFATALQDELGLTGDILKDIIDTVEAQGSSIKGVNELVAGLREVDTSLRATTIAYQKQGSFAKEVASLQENIGANLEKNLETQKQIGTALFGEALATRTIIAQKQIALKNTDLTREEYAKINDELAEQEQRLRDIGVQQDENTEGVAKTTEQLQAERIETILDTFRELGQYIDGDFAAAIEGA